MVSLSTLFFATRPWSFPVTVCAIATGGGLAFVDAPHRFSWPLFALCLLGAILVHAAANLINTYGDFVKGVDVKASADDRALVDGLVTSDTVYRLIVGTVVGAVLVLSVFLALIVRRQPTVTGDVQSFTSPVLDLLLLCAAGFFLAYAYTAPPFYWKYKGLGDICIIVAYGPLLVAGGYYCQLYTLPSLPALWFSLAPGLLTECILHVNNTRDQKWDAQCGAVTLPMRLGETGSQAFFIGLYVTTFTANLLAALHPSAFLPPNSAVNPGARGWGGWSWAQLTFLLPLLLIPNSLDLIRRYYAKQFIDLCPRCGELAGKWGLLQSIALVTWGVTRMQYTSK